jgi:formate-dependent nitrite reductase membrane component NrfD/ferredoxin
MYQRADGIVEFDPSVCIGCKACMQACPYDAIYIDPETNTAAKCHYCAHRTDIGLEPACVVVCPEHAIISGDMNDPQSEISRILAKQDVVVRKPEQGTAPKLFYIEGSAVSLHPTAVERAPETFMWADVIPLHPGKHGEEAKIRYPGELFRENGHSNGTPLRAGQPQGQPWGGPIQIGGSMAEHMVQVGYNAQHKIPWHWPVPAYLVTKSIGAGLFVIMSLGAGLGLFALEGLTAVVAGLLSLLFIALTTGLLVYDLEQPKRFLYILLRPQWRSWLTRGAVLLIGFSTIVGLWWLFEAGAYFGLYDAGGTPWRGLALWLGLPFALGAAIYTAFLFAQAEGRDLWQSPLLPFHLTVQAFVAGSGAILILNLFGVGAEMRPVALVAFIGSLLLDLFITLLGEFGIPHASEVAAKAAHEISHGRYRNHFWWGNIALGHILPIFLIGMTPDVLAASAAAGLAAIVGLYLYEYAFVMAPQEIPNS